MPRKSCGLNSTTVFKGDSGPYQNLSSSKKKKWDTKKKIGSHIFVQVIFYDINYNFILKIFKVTLN